MIISTLLLTSAVAPLAQSPGTDYLEPRGALAVGTTSVSQSASTYMFEFDGPGPDDVTYAIDTTHPNVQSGLLRIEELVYGFLPVDEGGMIFARAVPTRPHLPAPGDHPYADCDDSPAYIQPHDLAGHSLGYVVSSFTHSSSASSVVLSYSGTLGGTPFAFEYELELVGRSLRIMVTRTGSNSSIVRNCAGLSLGHASGMDTSERVVIPYMETMGTSHGSVDGEAFFYSTMIDYTQSSGSCARSAAHPVMTGTTTSGGFINSIEMRYMPMFDGDQTNAVHPVHEVAYVTVGKRVDDLFVTGPAPASPYRREMDDAMILHITEIKPTTPPLPGDASFIDNDEEWLNLTALMDELDSVGVRNLKTYLWQGWAHAEGVHRDPCDSTSILHSRHTWPLSVPPSEWGGSLQDFASCLDLAKSLPGGRVAGYTYYYAQHVEGAFYDPLGACHHNEDFGPEGCGFGLLQDNEKLQVFSRLATPDSITVGAAHALASHDYWENKIQTEVGFDFSYVDSHGAVFPGRTLITQDLTDGQPSTIRDVIIAYKELILSSRNIYEGPFLTEGTLNMENGGPSFPNLYRGYADLFERHLGGSLAPASSNDYYVLPDYELTEFKPYSTGAGFGLMSRFQGPTGQIAGETPLDISTSTEFFDEYVATLLSYGHAFYVNNYAKMIYSGADDTMHFPQFVRGYYMMCADLQGQILSNDVVAVRYFDAAGVAHTLSDHWPVSASVLDPTAPRLEVEYSNGLVLRVNHNVSDWATNAGGVQLEIPEDGWAAWAPGTDFLAFSAKLSGASERIDFVRSERRGFRMLDGRGSLTTYDGITAKNLVVEWWNGARIEEGPADFIVTGPGIPDQRQEWRPRMDWDPDGDQGDAGVWFYEAFNKSSGAYQDLEWNDSNNYWALTSTGASCRIHSDAQSTATGHESARVFRIPNHAAELRVRGEVSMVSGSTSGDGAIARILYRRSDGTESTIWEHQLSSGEQNIQASHENSHDIRMRDVPAGDAIVFRLDPISNPAFDVVRWDPAVDAWWAERSWNSVADFESDSVQPDGMLGVWSYEYCARAAPPSGPYVAMNPASSTRWRASDAGTFIESERIKPANNDASRVWTAPRAGTVRITSSIFKENPNVAPPRDGVLARIIVDGQTVWTEDITDALTPHDYQDQFEVQAGDRIVFRLNRKANGSADLSRWSVSMTLESAD